MLPGTVQDWWFDFSQGGEIADASTFWQSLFTYYRSSRFQGNIKWVHDDCNSPATFATCAPAKGIAHARIPGTLKMYSSGSVRYRVLLTMREDLKALFDDESGMKVFPFAFDFLFWEEVGIITSSKEFLSCSQEFLRFS